MPASPAPIGRRGAAIALAGAALLAAGCGGSSSNSPTSDAFRQALVQQLAALRAVGTSVTLDVQGAPHQTNAQLRRTFSVLAAQARPVLAGLARLQAPAKYRADVASLRASLGGAVTDLEAISRAARDGNARAAKLATDRLVSHSAQVKAADQRLSTALGPTTG